MRNLTSIQGSPLGAGRRASSSTLQVRPTSVDGLPELEQFGPEPSEGSKPGPASYYLPEEMRRSVVYGQRGLPLGLAKEVLRDSLCRPQRTITLGVEVVEDHLNPRIGVVLRDSMAADVTHARFAHRRF